MDVDAILKQLAEAYRYFGRVATDGELRLYGRSHPKFPAHSTFSNHFAGKEALIESLRVWISSRTEFQDVLALLPDATAAPVAVKRGGRDGSVYLLQAGQYYKIGRSEELERRVKEIRVAMPEATILVHAITTDDPPGIEAYWHRRFADRRANGEWFKLSPADVAVFKRRKFQ